MALALTALTGQASAEAAVKYWIGSTAGNYNDNTRWSTSSGVTGAKFQTMWSAGWLLGRAQRIQGRQTTGFRGAQEAGANVGADEHRGVIDEIQDAGENHGIGAREDVLENQIVSRNDVTAFHVNQANPVRAQVQGQPEPGRLKVLLRDLSSVTPSSQDGEGFSQREAADGQLIDRCMKQIDDHWAAWLEVVAFDEGTRIEEVQQGALSFVSHLGDVISQTAVDLGQPPVDFLDRDVARRQPAFGDVRFARRNADATGLQFLNRRMMVFDFRHRTHLLTWSLA
jgi:hypothetical protein